MLHKTIRGFVGEASLKSLGSKSKTSKAILLTITIVLALIATLCYFNCRKEEYSPLVGRWIYTKGVGFPMLEFYTEGEGRTLDSNWLTDSFKWKQDGQFLEIDVRGEEGELDNPIRISFELDTERGTLKFKRDLPMFEGTGWLIFKDPLVTNP